MYALKGRSAVFTFLRASARLWKGAIEVWEVVAAWRPWRWQVYAGLIHAWPGAEAHCAQQTG